MQIESLHDRRRDDRIAADVTHKLHRVLDSLFPAHAVGSPAEREVDRKVLQEVYNRRPLIDADARQLANTNARVRQRRDLCARQEVKTILVVILVYKNLRRLFRRDSLLNVVGEHLPEGEIGSYVDVRRGDEAVLEIMHSFNIQTRSTLIGVSIISGRTKDPILDGVESKGEVRPRVGACAQVGAKSQSSLCVDVVAKSEIG